MNHKLKCICRIEENQFHQEIFIDNQLQDASAFPEVQYALQFLEAFSPEQLLRQLMKQEPNAVFVFRTDFVQIQIFQDFLQNPLDILENIC